MAVQLACLLAQTAECSVLDMKRLCLSEQYMVWFKTYAPEHALVQHRHYSQSTGMINACNLD